MTHNLNVISSLWADSLEVQFNVFVQVEDACFIALTSNNLQTDFKGAF